VAGKRILAGRLLKALRKYHIFLAGLAKVDYLEMSANRHTDWGNSASLTVLATPPSKLADQYR